MLKTRWTDDEVAILLEHYGSEGACGVAKRIPHRSIHAIHVKANKLGHTVNRIKPNWADLMKRILSRVEISESGCWNWTGSLDVHGYGRMAFRGKNAKAFRVSWCAKNNSEWPSDKHGLHSCDNRRCVNPDHIKPGTNAENIKEAWERGGLRRYHLKNRTHCRHGHALTPDNIVTYPSIAPAFRCRACERASFQRRA